MNLECLKKGSVVAPEKLGWWWWWWWWGRGVVGRDGVRDTHGPDPVGSYKSWSGVCGFFLVAVESRGVTNLIWVLGQK